MDSTEVPTQSCPECAVQMPHNAAFCPACGRPMLLPTRAQGTVGIFSEKIAGALAYLTFVPAIIFLFVEPYKSNRFVRFHSLQCLIFCGATVVGAAILRLASLIFSLIPVLGPLILVVVVVLAILAAIFLWLVAVVKALQGEMFELPFVGAFARQYAGAL